MGRSIIDIIDDGVYKAAGAVESILGISGSKSSCSGSSSEAYQAGRDFQRGVMDASREPAPKVEREESWSERAARGREVDRQSK
jgi:hypothetical protein